MCPFSHGIFVLFIVCFALQQWNVNSYRISPDHHVLNNGNKLPLNKVQTAPSRLTFLSEVAAAFRGQFVLPTENTKGLQAVNTASFQLLQTRTNSISQKQSPVSQSLVFSRTTDSDLVQKDTQSAADDFFKTLSINYKGNTKLHSFLALINLLQSRLFKPCHSLACGLEPDQTKHGHIRQFHQLKRDRTHVSSHQLHDTSSYRSLRSKRSHRRYRSMKPDKRNRKISATFNAAAKTDSVAPGALPTPLKPEKGKKTEKDEVETEDQSLVELEVMLTEHQRPEERVVRKVAPNQSSQVSDNTEEPAVTDGTYRGLDGKPVNMTKFWEYLTEKEIQRRWNRAAQWAYLCLVLLLCLMMWTIWCLGGLQRCRYRPHVAVSFSDSQHKLTVAEVLQRKRQYLPMFNEPEWEDVLMCNRGSDP